MPELQFGLNVFPSAAPGTDPVAWARMAEDLGFDFVSANDHVHGSEPRYETWTMLSWIASATSRIRVASRVLGLPYREPAVVAKMAESFDRLSGGRLILGLGAGHSDEEFHALGLEERTPGEKLAALEEAIQVIRGMWADSQFSFAGRFYRTDSAEIEPKPDRRIPIWLGTFGDRALALTGRQADGWIPSLDLAPPERVPEMRGKIIAAAREAGRHPADITCVYNMEIRIDGRPAERVSVVSGSPDAVVERLAGFVELGFTAFNFIPYGPGKDEQAERLAREVIPGVRGGGWLLDRSPPHSNTPP